MIVASTFRSLVVYFLNVEIYSHIAFAYVHLEPVLLYTILETVIEINVNLISIKISRYLGQWARSLWEQVYHVRIHA